MVAVKLNTEKEGQSLAEKYQVASLPTLVLLDPTTQQEVGRIGGYLPADPLVERLRGIATQFKSLPGLEAKVVRNPADTASALNLLRLYGSMNRRAKAEEMLERIARIDTGGRRGHLAPALILCGDLDLSANSSRQAAMRFSKASQLATQPAEKGYAMMKLGICDATQGRLDSAIAIWQKVLTIPGCPADMKDGARSFIQRAKAMKAQSQKPRR